MFSGNLGKLGQMHDAGGIIAVLIVVKFGLAILRPNLNGSLFLVLERT